MKHWRWLALLAAIVAVILMIDVLARGVVARFIGGLWVCCMDLVLRLIMPVVS